MRIPVSGNISTKDGSSNKNARMTNMLAEEKQGKSFAAVRPGLSQVAIGSGDGNGLVCFNSELVSIYGNNVYAQVQRFTGGLEQINVDLPIGYVGQSVSKGDGIFCIVCGGAIKTSYVSSDGETWNTGTLPSISGNPSFSATGYGDSLFITFAYNKSECATSTDGLSWTQRTLPISGYWGSVAYGNNIFCCISVLSDVCVTSSDGVAWSSGVLPTNGSWKSIAFNGTTFCMVSATGKYAISTDCSTWETGNLPTGYSFSKIVSMGGIFVAMSTGSSESIVAVSQNGEDWTTNSLPSAVQWSDIAANTNSFLAVASNPNTLAASSSDGENWTEITISGFSNWDFVAVGNDKFLIVDSIDDIAVLLSEELISEYIVSGSVVDNHFDFALIP